MKIEINEDDMASLCAAIDHCLKHQGEGGVWHLSKLRRDLPEIRQKLVGVTLALSVEHGRKMRGDAE